MKVNKLDLQIQCSGQVYVIYAHYAHILDKGTITVPPATAPNNPNTKVIFKNCALFTNCIRRINNTQVDNTHDIDVVMPTYNLVEYRDNYSKTFDILWQYCRDEPLLNDDGEISDFTAVNATTLFI